MAAFKRAYALGVQLVELDVQLTRIAAVGLWRFLLSAPCTETAWLPRGQDRCGYA